jgi:hypothetical protein
MFTKIIKNKKILLYLIIVLGLVVLLILASGNKKTEKPQTEYIITEEEKGDAKEDTNGGVKEEVPPTQAEPQETTQGTEKISDDFEFAKHMEELYREYPWYSKLPIERDGYTLIWVVQEKAFRIIMRISEDSPEEEKKTLINQALRDIEEITGVSYENFPYYVVY